MVLRQSPLLEQYRALEAASEQMLAAARAHDWDRLCRLEAACSLAVATLRRTAESLPENEQERAERMRILLRIVANDEQLRRLCAPHSAVIEECAYVTAPATLH